MESVPIFSKSEMEQIIENKLYDAISKLGLQPPQRSDIFITRPQAAKLVGCNEMTIHNRLHRGVYLGKRVDKHVLISQNSILETMTPQQIETAEKKGYLQQINHTVTDKLRSLDKEIN